MRRRLFYGAGWLSLVLCVALVVVAVRSFWVLDKLWVGWWWHTPIAGTSGAVRATERAFFFTVGRAGFHVTTRWQERNPGDIIPRSGFRRWKPMGMNEPPYYPMFGPPDKFWRRLGFEYVTTKYGPEWIDHSACFPLALPIVLLGVLPAVALRRWLRERRTAGQVLCPVCEYDLRASLQRGACPECGAVFASPTGGTAPASPARR